MAQILQGFSYEVCSATSPNFIAFGLFILVFGISAFMHHQLVASSGEHMRFVCYFVVDTLRE